MMGTGVGPPWQLLLVRCWWQDVDFNGQHEAHLAFTDTWITLEGTVMKAFVPTTILNVSCAITLQTHNVAPAPEHQITRLHVGKFWQHLRVGTGLFMDTRKWPHN